jgi:hypothetical protein
MITSVIAACKRKASHACGPLRTELPNRIWQSGNGSNQNEKSMTELRNFPPHGWAAVAVSKLCTPCQPVPPDETRRTRPRAHGSRKIVPRSSRHQPPLASSVHTRFYLGVLMARRKADRYSHCHALCLCGRGTCPHARCGRPYMESPVSRKVFRLIASF